MDLEFSGLDNVTDLLRKMESEFEPEARKFLYQEGESVMAESKEHYVPVDLGTLKNSGIVNRPIREGETLIVILGYGGAASEYAIIVHEDPTAYHPVGQWKYLEFPMNGKAASRPRRAKEFFTEFLRDRTV